MAEFSVVDLTDEQRSTKEAALHEAVLYWAAQKQCVTPDIIVQYAKGFEGYLTGEATTSS